MNRYFAIALSTLALGCGGTTDGTVVDAGCSGMLCGDICVDATTDRVNCGACGNACGHGLVCIEGACVLECPDGLTRCGDSCKDTANDPVHCGSCDAACGASESCVAGKCETVCRGGTKKCGDRCVDVALDPLHCGECDTKCDLGLVCSEGSCGLTCVGGTTKCGDHCVDTKSDPDNCGGCDTKCIATAACEAGTCGCPVAKPLSCGTECVDPQNDPSNCGACGNACGSGKCEAGKCLVVEKVALGEKHACAIVHPGKSWPQEVRCWSATGPDPSYPYPGGAAGPPRPPGATGPAVIPFFTSEVGEKYRMRGLLAGREFSCVIVETDPPGTSSIAEARCWGSSYSGAITTSYLPYYPWPVLPRDDSAAAGDDHVCAFQAGRLRCRGNNNHGQLAAYDDSSSSCSALTTSTYFREACSDPCVPLIPADLSTAKLFAAGDRSCAIDKGKVQCWGAPYAGDGSTVDEFGAVQVWPRADAVSSTNAVTLALSRTHTCLIDDKKDIYCWGNSYEVGLGGTYRPVKGAVTADAIAVGDNFTCTLLDGGVRCWGGITGSAIPADVSGLTADVVSITAAYSTACAIKKNGSLWCWGANPSGILGSGAAGAASSKTPVRMVW